jgi:hypothetical protein
LNKKRYEDAWYSQRVRTSDKWEHYFEIYDHLLGKFYDQQVNYLEIGVQDGGSLETARKLFDSRSVIVGLDIDPNCKTIEKQGLADAIIIGSQTDGSTLQTALTICPSGFDIIIDDGSHVQNHMVSTFVQMFPHLKQGGVYVIEDTHTNYSYEHQEGFFGIGLYDYFKGLSERINLDFMNAENRMVRFKQPRETRSPQGHPEPVLREIFSIEFFNSIVAIRKKTQNEPLRIRH